MAKIKNLNFMNTVLVPSPKKSTFNLSHHVLMSANMGPLYPVMVTDLVPGDTIDVSNSALVRLAPMVAPMMSNPNVTFHTWAVPYRILWENWSDYITETKTAGVLPAFPYIEVDHNGANWTPLMDYMGIPNPVTLVHTANEKISAMRFAAYTCAVNEFYRDENLQTPEYEFQLVDGDNTSNTDLLTLRNRAWQRDYFTSNLPFAQKGDAVELPLAGFNDVNIKRNAVPGVTQWPATVGPTPVILQHQATVDPSVTDELYADTSTLTATAATINNLRTAEAVQKYLERAARAGTRLVEWIKGMFSETLPDYTAQRPQYVGGSVSPIQISEVLNTTGIVGELPQGNMSGRGIGITGGKQGHYHAREHCVLITLMNIQPETGYYQGIEREFFKINDPKEFLNPMFAHLGEQETYNAEIMAFQASSGAQSGTFGYLPRYSEYRTVPNRVAGTFRTTEDYWHMYRKFATLPALNADFIQSNPTHRVFADTDPTDQKLYIKVVNQLRATRPLPLIGTPQL